ncbi:rhodanese-like domain-containing protein [Chryseobacterium echinoideorum]|uniref:rhodanese-like domain-containing protein n=1 Tax=Chryseobacterium echinoideorum TaxID=1549648 RepID=UPI001E3E790F|nr:rhodanese-like domain-containing protein [Chryseobacterium echinoideorum]
MMKKLNKEERPLLIEVPKHQKLSKEEFMKAYNDGVKVIDTRNKEDFAKGFLPESINIQGNNSFSTWMGWLVDYSEPFILVAQKEQIEDLTRKLMRIGMDQMMGYIDNVESLGLDLKIADVINIKEFKSYLNREDVQVIDVRNNAEYETNHIENAENVFVGILEDNLDKISCDKQIVIHCQSGDRATIAYSVLKKNSFENVKNFSGGMKEWLGKGNLRK